MRAKKVKGRTRYFGKIANDPKGEAALEKWLREKDELLAGREPSADPNALICGLILISETHPKDYGI